MLDNRVAEHDLVFTCQACKHIHDCLSAEFQRVEPARYDTIQIEFLDENTPIVFFFDALKPEHEHVKERLAHAIKRSVLRKIRVHARV